MKGFFPLTRNNADFQGKTFEDVDMGSYRKLVLSHPEEGTLAQVEYKLAKDKTRPDGTPLVKVDYLKSLVEGQGHGQAVMHELYKRYPDSTINWGKTLNKTSRHMASKFDGIYSRTQYR
jgi:hypothetical protein